MAEFQNESSKNPFTHYYAQMIHQGNMLQDHVRTGTYQQAFLRNMVDFKDKTVLDVGTGTGILAFFACQAGAKKVYAVDASSSVEVARRLSEANGFSDRIEFIQGRIEEVNLPEKVDVIISEPIGFLLVHERMIESYVRARDRFLKPGGLMFPSSGSIVLAPLCDPSLHEEQSQKATFWEQSSFFGIDLRPALPAAQSEHFTQPIVGYFPSSMLISSQRTVHSIDFSVVTCEELARFEVPFSLRIDKTSLMHGLGGWFDLTFQGTQETLSLSTAPDMPGTHWYQCRLLFQEPLAVNRGQRVEGSLLFAGNDRYSYNLSLSANIQGTSVERLGEINLHDQTYHYLTSSSSAYDVNGNSHGSQSS